MYNFRKRMILARTKLFFRTQLNVRLTVDILTAVNTGTGRLINIDRVIVGDRGCGS
jgi:hypothetical protein